METPEDSERGSITIGPRFSTNPDINYALNEGILGPRCAAALTIMFFFDVDVGEVPVAARGSWWLY